VTSFIDIRYGNVALKSSIKEQPSVICLLWAKALSGVSANANPSEMRPIYGDKYFTRPAIHVWCKKFAHDRESFVDEAEPGRHVVSTTDATIAAVDSLMHSDRRVTG